MRVTTKLTASLDQFLVNVTGMVMHGHGDGAYAHYSKNLWPGDSNFTISPLARLLRPLEQQQVRLTRDLFPYPPSNSFFEVLMQSKSRCLGSLLEVLSPSPTERVPLPKYLYLQLDNSAKDNKNRYLMAFLSVLHILECLAKFRLDSYW